MRFYNEMCYLLGGDILYDGLHTQIFSYGSPLAESTIQCPYTKREIDNMKGYANECP